MDRPERPGRLPKAQDKNPADLGRFEWVRVRPYTRQTHPGTRSGSRAPYRPILDEGWHSGRPRNGRLTERSPCWFSVQGARRDPKRRSYHPQVPGAPLKGPIISGVIQPP